MLFITGGLLGQSVYSYGNIDVYDVTISSKHKKSITDLYLEGKYVTISNVNMNIGMVQGMR